MNLQLHHQAQHQAQLLSESTSTLHNLEEKRADLSVNQLVLEGKLVDSQKELEQSIAQYKNAEAVLREQQEETKQYRFALLEERTQISEAKKLSDEKEAVREERARANEERLQSTLDEFQQYRAQANEEKANLQAQINELARKNEHLRKLGDGYDYYGIDWKTGKRHQDRTYR